MSTPRPKRRPGRLTLHERIIKQIEKAISRKGMEVALYTEGEYEEFRCAEVGWVVRKRGQFMGGSCFQRGVWEPSHAYAILAVEMLYLALFDLDSAEDKKAAEEEVEAATEMLQNATT